MCMPGKAHKAAGWRALCTAAAGWSVVGVVDRAVVGVVGRPVVGVVSTHLVRAPVTTVSAQPWSTKGGSGTSGSVDSTYKARSGRARRGQGRTGEARDGQARSGKDRRDQGGTSNSMQGERELTGGRQAGRGEVGDGVGETHAGVGERHESYLVTKGESPVPGCLASTMLLPLTPYL